MSIPFENRDLQNVIEQAEQLQTELKKSAVKELLQIVNGICKRKDLTYFAVGELLQVCRTGEDPDNKNGNYRIGMLQEDVNTFFEFAASGAEKLKIEVSPFSEAIGHAQRSSSRLKMSRETHAKNGYARVDLVLYVDPYESLGASDANLGVADATLGTSDAALGASDVGADSAASQPDGFLRCPGYAPHPKDTIFPLQKVSYEGTHVMAPCRQELFTGPAKEEQGEVLFEGKKATLLAFDKLCRMHELKYTVMEQLAMDMLHGGEGSDAVKGAAWMIGMLRDDYELMAEVLADSAEEYGLVFTSHPDKCPDVHADYIGIAVPACAQTDPWLSYDPVQIYPLDALSDDYDTLHKTISSAIRTYRRFLKQMEREASQGVNRRAISKDSHAAFAAMQEERMQIVRSTVPENRRDKTRRVYTIYENRPCIFYRKSIFPVQRYSFCGMKIYGPVIPYVWHEVRDDLYAEMTAEKKTELLKQIDALCTDEGIEYFAISALAAGAVMYNDILPESKNTRFEIGLLRNDYEKLVSALREKGEAYGLQVNEFEDPQHHVPMYTRNVSKAGEVAMDIYVSLNPFDKVPEDFYLYQAFNSDINRQNSDFNALMRSHTYTGPLNHTIIRNPVTREVLAQASSRRLRPAALPESARRTGYIFSKDPVEEAKRIDQHAQIFDDDDRTDTYMRVALRKSERITGEQLFPLRKVQFRDMLLSCPNDTSVWQPMLNEKLERQVSCIQKADLLLLRELDRVCKELKIGYFVCGGTMLGYVRHGGFIPWDDDVDVAMLRADYDRFISEAGPLLKEGFFLQTRQTDPNIPYLFSKVRLDDTAYITRYNEYRDFHKGICLDIFPFDYLPDEPERCMNFVNEVIELSKVHHRIAGRRFKLPEDQIEPRNEQEAEYLKKIHKELESNWKIDLAKSQKDYIEAATRYNAEAEEKGLHVVASYIPDFTYIDLRDLLPYQRGMFEDVEVSVLKRPDVFLTMQYGDYMKLPPRHMQVAHELLYWKTWEASSDDEVEDGEVESDGEAKVKSTVENESDGEN